MSSSSLLSAGRQVRESTLRVLWRQWGTLGASTASNPARSLIDPEALVLASLSFQEGERRLPEVLRWWAKVGAPLLSVTRIRTLANSFPEATRERLGEFATHALHEGHDYRWRPLLRPVGGPEGRRGKALAKEPRFTTPHALLLRLRLGFGITVKADLVTMLLGTPGVWLTVKDMATSLGYTPQSIRRAADDLVAACLIRVTGTTPAGYMLDPSPWAGVLGTPATLPPWRHWVPVFAFVAALGDWMPTEADLKGMTDYLLSSRARDFVADHQAAFTQNQIAIPQMNYYPGDAYLAGFEETVVVLREWLDECG
jgi:hypothetical protein